MRKTSELLKVSPCRRIILSQVQSSGTLSLFSKPKVEGEQLLGGKHDIPVKNKTVGYPQMISELPSGVDIVHRGMAGFKEVESIAKEGKLGAGKYKKRLFNLDIAKFIHDPDSCALLSTSPDRHTVREYMVGYQLITAKGAIASMCLPAVFIRPQTARHVYPEQFAHYQSILDAQVELGNRTRSENIVDLAQGNNETTVILGATKEDDWSPVLDDDLHSIVLVWGAGRIFSGFTKAETVDATTIVNPSFRRRIMSLEVFSTASGKGKMFDEVLKTMDKRAQELGLIEDVHSRGLTLADASTLMSSPEYQGLIRKYTTTGETMILKSVPKNIPVGSEELVEYAAFLIESNPLKEPIIPKDIDSSLHL